MIDLRSDTVTKPTEGMRQAMAQATVGDDVFQEDPTANALEQKIADLLGFEAGLFVPSGVMSNQIAVKILTEPGDEVLIEQGGHIFNYETTSASLISSVQLQPLQGERGKLNANQIQNAVRPNLDWVPHTRVAIIENTTNKGGGACYEREEVTKIRQTVKEQNLSLHLDGARIWNAMERTGVEASFWGDVADTMTVCFSKGLGAPVGSMLLSSEENIQQARRVRKMLGGGMRQIGVLAAAADYAIENHRSLLGEDHRRARELAETIANCKQLIINPETVETNIIIFDIKNYTAQEAIKMLEEEGIQVVPFGPQTLRATFHFQVGDEGLTKAQQAFKRLFN